MEKDKSNAIEVQFVDDSQNEEIKSKSIESIPNQPPETIQVKAASCSSIKTKKSSNILSALVKRTKRNKNKKSDTLPKSIDGGSQNLNFVASQSSLASERDREIELHLENFEKNGVSNEAASNKESINNGNKKITPVSDSEHSLQSATKNKYNFFRKFMKESTSLENENKKSEHALAIQTSNIDFSDSKKTCNVCQREENDFFKENDRAFYLPSTFVNFGKSTLNITLANGLQIVQELACRLQENENHFLQIFSRYIKDPSFQKELVDTLSQHSKIQWETERRTSALANDMWMQQIEIGRTQERTLQETLNSLVKQNRQLQVDNETMFRRHETLVKKLRSVPEIHLKYRCIDYESQLEHILNHNGKLQNKLEALFRQNENLENELHLLQRQNDSLDQQLRHSSSQMQNLKALFQRTKTDYELKLVSISNELKNSEDIVRNAVEAGDVLLDDLDGIKRQSKIIPLTINWAKFKCRGSGLTDLIHLCRSCLNELSKEIVSLYTQVKLKDKDIEILQENNTKLQENLKKSTTELDVMAKKIDEGNLRDVDKILAEQKCKLLETDLKIAQEQMEKVKLQYDLDKTCLLNTISEYEQINNDILEKDKMIEQTKMFISNITSENMALRSQVDGLNRILSETGAGDMVKELSNNQEELAQFQAQHYQLLNEKQYLLDKIEMLKTDNKTMLDHQEINYKHLQKQLQDLETMNEENNLLRQQYETEHKTVLSLQNERKKYLEEKTMLKTVFHHIKSEISRVQKLESTITDIGKEANKLAMIAEYNKQLGDKLKTEIIEKDKIILQLRGSVEKLNNIQIKNTNEKLSLCYELSEVCQIKDHLNSALNLEVQKNIALDDSKKEIVQSASTQIKKYEEQQKSERSTLKDLLRDLKAVVQQRDESIKEKEKLQQELASFKSLHEEELKKLDVIVFEKNDSELKLKNLIAKHDEDKSIIKDLQNKLSAEVSKYSDNVRQLEKLIVQLREEKKELHNSVQYLQNNTKKLHNDLNESRESEKMIKDSFNNCVTEKKALEKELIECKKILESTNDDKEKSAKETEHLNSLCEKILLDFEANIKSSMEKEDMFRKELDESRVILLSNAREIEQLTGTLHEKQVMLEKLNEECNCLKQKEKQHTELAISLETLKMDFKEIKNRKEKLENDYYDLNTEYDTAKIQLSQSKQQVEELEKQLKLVLKQKEEDYMFYKKHLDESLRKTQDIEEKNKAEISQLKFLFNDASQKLENERIAYAALSQIQKDVSAKFIRSIKDIVDEKNAKEEAVLKLKETISCLENFKLENTNLQQQVNVLLNGLNDGKNRINTLTQEKHTSQKILEDLQNKYNDLFKKCSALENQLRGADLDKNAEQGNLREYVDRTKRESQEKHNLICTLKQEIAKLQQQITNLEFQKSEVTLRLHEMQRKLETEKGLCEQLKNTHRLVLAAVLKMKEDGKVDLNDCNYLLHMVQSSSSSDTVDDEEFK